MTGKPFLIFHDFSSFPWPEWTPGFPGTGHSTQKRTRKGPSKLCYGRRFYATYWLSKLKLKWLSNYIIVACISITWWSWENIYNKNGTVSLDCNMAGVSSASSSHTTYHCTAAQIQLPIRKILLFCAPTSQQWKGPPGPMGWIKGLKTIKRPFYWKSISKDLKGPLTELWRDCPMCQWQGWPDKHNQFSDHKI